LFRPSLHRHEGGGGASNSLRWDESVGYPNADVSMHSQSIEIAAWFGVVLVHGNRPLRPGADVPKDRPELNGRGVKLGLRLPKYQRSFLMPFARCVLYVGSPSSAPDMVSRYYRIPVQKRRPSYASTCSGVSAVIWPFTKTQTALPSLR